jgi:hypothetical protein
VSSSWLLMYTGGSFRYVFQWVQLNSLLNKRVTNVWDKHVSCFEGLCRVELCLQSSLHITTWQISIITLEMILVEAVVAFTQPQSNNWEANYRSRYSELATGSEFRIQVAAGGASGAWLYCSPSLLFNGYRGYFSRVKGPGHKVNNRTPFVLRLRISGAVLLLPLHGVDMEKLYLSHFFNFTARFGGGTDIPRVKLGRPLLTT